MIKTDRLTIETPTLKDLDNLFELLNNEEILKYNCMLHKTQEEVKQTILKENNQFGIYLDNRLIGLICIEDDGLRYEVNSICISYMLLPKYQHLGYMQEALTSFISLLFTTYEIISARVFVPNIPSNKLLRRLGFTLEGTLKKAVKGYNGVIYDDNLYVLFKENKENNEGRIPQ